MTRRFLAIAALFVCMAIAVLIAGPTRVLGQDRIAEVDRTAKVGSAGGDDSAGGAMVEVQDSLVTYRGQTMGTTYMVKLFAAPEAFVKDAAAAIDAELRRVNDQMSTYVKSSEISRFNALDSTQWFDVSRDTARVVDYALEVSRKTDGAFDITVEPIVNLWSFGPEKRTWVVPSDAEIATRLAAVGHQFIEVRLDPPSLKKMNPHVQLDLSAIAKGHGVDRIVELLGRGGAANVFVEIGGEVRVTGDKGGTPWMVGIQQPDSETNALLVRQPLRDAAMATSGDYRNRFEIDGKYFSHTIDPRTGKPITHGLASVTVIADDCMTADAWATAIDVLGPEAGLVAAKKQGLDVLLATRTTLGDSPDSKTPDGEARGDNFVLSGAGSLAKYAVADMAKPTPAVALPTTWARLFPILLATLVMFGVVLAAMSVGVIFGGKPISGSCGGLAGTTNDNGTTRCSLCSNPVDGCKELRDRIQKQSR